MVYTFGGIVDDWGETLTDVDINDADFGVVVATNIVGTPSTHYIDHIKMTIYYTGGVSDSCTYSSGDWNVDCADNCNITSNVALGGNNITITGTGTFTTEANITQYTNLTIKGTDTSNKCIVRCFKGGCFKAA